MEITPLGLVVAAVVAAGLVVVYIKLKTFAWFRRVAGAVLHGIAGVVLFFVAMLPISLVEGLNLPDAVSSILTMVAHIGAAFLLVWLYAKFVLKKTLGELGVVRKLRGKGGYPLWCALSLVLPLVVVALHVLVTPWEFAVQGLGARGRRPWWSIP